MYESHFGFSRKPFQLSPDPSFFYGSKLHSRALAYLQYGLNQGEGFIVITGPVGTGKTTVAKNLLGQLKANEVVAAQIVTSTLSPTELLALICGEFGIRSRGETKSELLQQLEAFFKQLHNQRKRALLVVDEAQNLPPETVEELRMLSNFQVDGRPLLQSFLLGQEELRGIISAPNMEQFRQRIIASCHLCPLDVDETQHYIEHRLHLVDWNNKFPKISRDAFEKIFENTSGIPRKINIFCDRLLLFCFLENITDIDAATVQEVVKELKEELTGGMQSPSYSGTAQLRPVGSSEPTPSVLDHQIPPAKVNFDTDVRQRIDKHLDQALREHQVRLARYVNLLVKTATEEFKKNTGQK